MPSSTRLLWLGLVVFCFLGLVLEDKEAWTEADDELPPWASDNTLQLQLSADSTEYAVIPLTERLALGSTTKRTGVSCGQRVESIPKLTLLQVCQHKWKSQGSPTVKL